MTGVPVEYVGPGGQIENMILEGVMENGVVVPLELVGVQGDTVAPPPVKTLGYVGVYSTSDQFAIDWFGQAPAVANTYYQPNQQGLNITSETTRINRGTSPNITITTKGTDLLEQIYDGTTAGMDWLTTYANALITLSRVNPAVPVYGSLIHEAMMQVNKGVTDPAEGLTGRSAEAAVIGGAQAKFFDLVKNTAVQSTYWIVGFNRTFETAVGNGWGTSRPKVMEFDPYANGPNDTIATITAADLTWFRNQTWYDGQPIGLGEFGMPVANGDTALGRFYTDVAGQLKNLGLLFGVFFDRSKDNNHQISIGTAGSPSTYTYPLAVAAFRASLAAGPPGAPIP